MTETKLQKWGGICALFMALIYIVAFIFYGGILTFPGNAATAKEELLFLETHHLVLSILNFTSYVLFGILLAILVMALHHRLRSSAYNQSKIAAVFGIIWVGLVIASGMIANIALDTVLAIGDRDPETAILIHKSVAIVTEGLGGGNEIIGGIWVTLVSLIGWQAPHSQKALHVLGFIVGFAGILSVIPLDLFKVLFGLGQILWFLGVGISMLRAPLLQATA